MLLLIALAGALAGQAWASSRPAWVIPECLNVRKGPSQDSDRVTSLGRGDKVTVTAFRSDRWCRVTLDNGNAGWVKEEYLEFSRTKARALTEGQDKRQEAPPAWVAEPVVNLRSKPDVGSDVVTQLKRGDKVYVVDRDGNWRRVKASSGKYGWIRSDLLELDVDKGRRLADKRDGQDKEPTPAWINGNVVNVRNGPSTGYSRVGQFTRGTKVYVLDRKGEWVQCKGPECAGWIHAELLETDVEAGRALAASPSTPGRDKAYCVGGTVNLREGPGTGADRVDQVRQGDTLWVLEEKNKWVKVETLEGKTGWIAGWYVRRHGAKTTVAPEPAAEAPKPPGKDFPSPTRPSEETKLQPFSAWIAEDATNVRYGPGVDRDVKFQLAKHTPVQVVETQGQWCRVRTQAGTYGWAAGWVLDFQPPGEPEAAKVVNGEPVEAKAGWVNRPRVNVRSAPGTDNDVLRRAKLGTGVVITDKQSGWFRVALEDGTTGWVAENLIKTRAEQAALEEPRGSSWEGESGQGRAVVREAMRHLGKGYVRGTSGPDTFDCSGLTSYVYRQFGVSLPRTCAGQYTTGRPVSRDELALGDIVIFRNTYRAGISHVGIYIGQGRFVHASNSRGGVKITDLDSSYYAQRYVGARRMF